MHSNGSDTAQLSLTQGRQHTLKADNIHKYSLLNAICYQADIQGVLEQACGCEQVQVINSKLQYELLQQS